MTSAAMRLSSDSERKPWAMVPPNGVCAAAPGSTWMNWRSSVASAKASMRSWSIVDPVGRADLAADLGADFVEGGEGIAARSRPAAKALTSPAAGDATASWLLGLRPGGA